MEQEGLFEEPPRVHVNKRVKPIKSVKSLPCPSCRKKKGLLRDTDGTLYWRDHLRWTARGIPLHCAGSGQRLDDQLA